MQEFNFDQSAHIYRAMPGLNKSSIEKLLDCPLAYKLGLEQKDEPTPAMAFGTLVHSMILEPDTVSHLYHVMQGDLRTKTGKTERDKAIAEGKTIVSASDFQKAKAMQARVQAHPAAGWLLGLPGKSEVSMFWEMPTEDGRVRQCKARADRIAQVGGGEIIIDLKTHSGAVSPSEIERTVARFGYHRQAAWYCDGYERIAGKPCHGFYFIFISTTAPYLVTAGKMNDEAQAIGWGDCLKAERILHECEESGSWPGYADSLIEIDLPAWAYKKAAEEMDIPSVPF
jgi:exodeoxyribonuclease VIII